MVKNSVIVYSTKSCPWCHKAKSFLDSHKVAYESVDVGADQVRAQEMLKKSGQMGVPVIDVNNTIIIGFNEDKLKEALQLN